LLRLYSAISGFRRIVNAARTNKFSFFFTIEAKLLQAKRGLGRGQTSLGVGLHQLLELSIEALSTLGHFSKEIERLSIAKKKIFLSTYGHLWAWSCRF